MIKLIYNDIAVGSREAFEPTATGAADFSHIDEIRRPGITFPHFSTVGELNQTLLDGSMVIMPDDTTDEYIGLWSDSLSGTDGSFAAPPTITMTATELYTSLGITITTLDAFPSRVNIKWYRDDTLLDDVDFTPDSNMYYCEHRVDNYNRIVVTFNALILPYHRLKVIGLIHGRIREFDGHSIAGASIIQEVSPITAEISIDTFDFTLIGDENIDYVFQRKQSLEIYSNGELLGVFFVRSYRRTAERFYEVSSEDYIGLLDAVQFMGSIYTRKNAFELLTEIFDLANVPFTMDDALKSETVTGWIPICSCREAVRQICFAIGAAVDTSLSDLVRIFVPSNEVAHYFPLNEIMQGQTLVDRDKRLTEVRLTVHGYAAGDKSKKLYEAAKSGSGDGILVEFSSPMHDLAITSGTIVESDANYAIINAAADTVLSGIPYDHTTAVMSKKNPVINSGDPANVAAVEKMTLISADNAAARLQSLYDYYMVQGTINSALVLARPKGNVVAKPGDVVEISTVYAGVQTARLESARYRLFGGAIVADTTAK